MHGHRKHYPNLRSGSDHSMTVRTESREQQRVSVLPGRMVTVGVQWMQWNTGVC